MDNVHPDDYVSPEVLEELDKVSLEETRAMLRRIKQRENAENEKAAEQAALVFISQPKKKS